MGITKLTAYNRTLDVIRSGGWVSALLAYLVIGLASTFRLFTIPGIIGHNWDWAITWNPAGTLAWAHASLSSWWTLEAGTPNVGMSNTPYFYLAALFAYHPWFFSRLLLVGVPVAGAMAGRFLTLQAGGSRWAVTALGAWIGGLVLGFSPLFFNELHAGAITQVLAHAGFALGLGCIIWHRRTGYFVPLAFAAAASVLVALSVTDFALFFLVGLAALWGASWRAYASYLAMVQALNSYWLLPFVYSASTILPEFHAIQENLVNQVPQPWQLFTFTGYVFSFFDYSSPVLVWLADIATLITVFASFYAIARAGLSFRALPYYALLFIGVGISAVAVGPFGRFMVWAYGHIPFIGLFRSPQHLLILPLLGACIVVGLGCSVMTSGRAARVLGAALLVLAVAGRAPYLTGDYCAQYLAQAGPGRAFGTFRPSPGAARAIEEIEKTAPAYARPLFIPLTFTPFFLPTPYQGAGQGGDPASMQLANMRGTILDMAQVLTPSVASIEDQLVQRMPDVLNTGVPALLDVSHVMIHYDSIAAFPPFQYDRDLAYNVAHTLDSKPAVWRRSISEDFVDLYQANAPPHVFLASETTGVAGDVSDVADVELPRSVLAAEFSGTPPAAVPSSPEYSFESAWDFAIDRAGGDAGGAARVARTMNFTVPRNGDYVVALKRAGGSDITSVDASIDGLDLTPLVQWPKIRSAELAGARWIEFANLHLAGGNHRLEFELAPDAIAAAALIPALSVPATPDYSYLDGAIIGVRGPTASESNVRVFRTSAARRVRVFAVGQRRTSVRELPAETVLPGRAAPSRYPFVYLDEAVQPQDTFIPPYWYVQAAQPRLFPQIALLPVYDSVNYTIDVAGARSTAFNISLTAINRARVARLKTGSQEVTRLLPVSLREPAGSLDAATSNSERPATVRLESPTATGSGTVSVSFAPSVDVLGADRGLPVALAGPTYIELGRPHIAPGLAANVASQGSRSDIFGSSITAVPVRNIQHIVVALQPTAPIPSDILPEANAYLQCAGALRAYLVPSTFTFDPARSSLNLDLSTLRGNPDSHSCAVIGFAARFASSNPIGVPSFTIAEADVFTQNTWLDVGPVVPLQTQGNAFKSYRLGVPPNKRYLSLDFASSDFASFYVTDGDVPIGREYPVTGWRVETDKLPGYVVYSAPLADAVWAELQDNGSRTVLRVGKKNIVQQANAPDLDPYWYLQSQRIYVAWRPSMGSFVAATLYDVPQEWFEKEGVAEKVILDLGVRRGRKGAILIHPLGVNQLPTARYVDVLAKPREDYSLKLDGRDLRLSADAAAEGFFAATRSRELMLAAGTHSVIFPSDAVERFFVERLPLSPSKPLQTVNRLHGEQQYKWTLSVRARRSDTVLGFLESYNPHWRLYGINGARHFVLNGYANGWVLPAGAATDLTLYYDGQNWLFAGLLIEAAAVVCITVLGFFAWRRKVRL